MEQNAGRLDELDVDQPVVLVQNLRKVLEHVLLNQVVHEVPIELFGVDRVFGDVSNDLHHHLLVALGDHVHMLRIYIGWLPSLRGGRVHGCRQILRF